MHRDNSGNSQGPSKLKLNPYNSSKHTALAQLQAYWTEPGPGEQPHSCSQVLGVAGASLWEFLIKFKIGN